MNGDGSRPFLSLFSFFEGRVLLAQEQSIRELCERVCICEDDAQCIHLLAHLKLLTRDYIQNLPDKVLNFPSGVEIEEAS